MIVRLTRTLLGILFVLGVAACGRAAPATQITDITGVMPPLAFHMVRVNDGTDVDGAKYRGKIVVLYFGYTHCPDLCPATLANLATALQKLRQKAESVRVLFVTVDPDRDTPSVLKDYARAFAPQVDGLRGSADEIARLARRYRVLYSVMPASPSHTYEVTHSSSVFFFDRQGRARFVTMDTGDTRDVVARLETLLG